MSLLPSGDEITSVLQERAKVVELMAVQGNGQLRGTLGDLHKRHAGENFEVHVEEFTTAYYLSNQATE
jgi:hypothetical protein